MLFNGCCGIVAGVVKIEGGIGDGMLHARLMAAQDRFLCFVEGGLL